MEIYVVKSGDTVDSIAERYGIAVSSVIYDNQLRYPYPLALGQALLISAGASAEPSYPAWVNGYAYPFIQQEVLSQTLPYLSSLSVFSILSVLSILPSPHLSVTAFTGSFNCVIRISGG